ncbi:MAG TPA: hypothetical protein VKG79_01415, partial [Bryobacteraceae bacterium]|nr:hypothetical protein [Bryobacteraceae bacterium]
RVYAINAVAGVLDLFAFSSAPNDGEIVTVQTRNAIPSRLTVDQARTIVIEKVRRIVFQVVSRVFGICGLRRWRLGARFISRIGFLSRG